MRASDVDDVRVHVPVRHLCLRVGCVAWGLKSGCMLVLVPVVSFVTPLAPRPASCQVVAAPRCCVASCAGIRILSQGLAEPCISELSVIPQSEASLSGGRKMSKDGFPGRDS